MAVALVTGGAAQLEPPAALALGRGARRLLVKTREGIVRLEASADDEALARALLHPDGFLNVPVLIAGETLVRGYTPELYAEALGGGPAPARS